MKTRDIQRTLYSALIAINDNRLQELIRHVLLVVSFDGLDDAVLATLDLLTLTLDQTIDSDLNPLPSLIAVHGVVPPDYRRDFAVTELLGEVEELLRVL